MICPKCANDKTKVSGTVNGSITERFRNCPKCSSKFQTIEIVKTGDVLRAVGKVLEIS